MDITVAEEMIGPGVEMRDPIRLQLLKEIEEVIERVPQKSQALLILCDVGYVRSMRNLLIATDERSLDVVQIWLDALGVDDLVTMCKLELRSPFSESTFATSQHISSPVRSAVGPETQTPVQEEGDVILPPSKRRHIGSQAPSSHASAESRSQHVSTMCKDRDNHRCIISKLAGPLDAAHIVPYSLYTKDRRNVFFNLLRNYWLEHSEKLQRILKVGTELVEIMLTFTPTVHRLHTEGLFALQPVEASHDGKSLKVRFYWLRQRESNSNTMVKLTEFPDFPDDTQLGEIKMYNFKDDHLIQSGEIIELTTSNPEVYPLPNWDLLEIQWILQLITLRGAADVPGMIPSKPGSSSDYRYSEEVEESDEAFEEGLTVDEGTFDRIKDWIDTQPIP
ncbi:hypothetical protein AJ78_06938 [Emergomyces pasteurianus Ep9510]|uniref:HNH nuclease domain-containing protein n=1 Tax=Emergomyces pasteurianus Ep9510 TaxID=1447872 RepID=A0A1J9PX69_9EURO|nr:hypothetical protein AJ78_06938 [Emergomyces pasteurianus Ep9510]